MNITVHEWSNDTLGRFALVKIATDNDAATASDPAGLDAALAARPLLNLALVLDVSGSMRAHMPSVVRTALGAVDVLGDGAFLRVITFDQQATEILPRTRLDAGNRDSIKETLRTRIVNRDGMTNMEDALVTALREPNQSVLLMTDGLANVGMARDSEQLTALVRTLPAYATSVVHALGVQHDAVTALNANFLKAMATDTSGSFCLADDAEALTAFLGDVIADHAMRAHERMSVRCILSDGSEGVAVLARPLQGYCVRRDRPTSIVFRLPLAVAVDGGPTVERIMVNSVLAQSREHDAADGCGGVFTVAAAARSGPAADSDVAAIVGCAVTDLLATTHVRGRPNLQADLASNRRDALDAIKALVPTHASLAPIAVALEAAATAAPGHGAAHETGAHVRQAAALYSACSNVPWDSPAIMTARHLTRAISSRQDPGHDEASIASMAGGGGGGGRGALLPPVPIGGSYHVHGMPPLRPTLAPSPSVVLAADASAAGGRDPALPGSSIAGMLPSTLGGDPSEKPCVAVD